MLFPRRQANIFSGAVKLSVCYITTILPLSLLFLESLNRSLSFKKPQTAPNPIPLHRSSLKFLLDHRSRVFTKKPFLNCLAFVAAGLSQDFPDKEKEEGILGAAETKSLIRISV